MRAAFLETPGQPLVIKEVSVPKPGIGQLLLKLEACGVCHTDVHVWERGSADLRAPRPLTLGHEGIGRVVEIGAGAVGWSIGDRAGLAWIHDTCGACDECSGGHESFCQTHRAHGFTVHGGFAEYAVVDARFAARLGEQKDVIQLAPLMCAGLTAFGAIERADVRADHRVAIVGCGGLGMYAVQLARRRGATVYAFDVSEAKLARARSFDAIGLKSGTSVGELAGTMHSVINFAPTPATWPLMTSLIRPRGAIIAAALVNQPVPLDQEWLTATGVNITGTSVGTREQMKSLLAIHAEQPLACETTEITLDDVTAGLASLRDGKVAGRLVVRF
jgi:alcohol dehydrogenase, propanol-preferring